MEKKTLVRMLQSAIFAALLCIFSPLAIYVGPVPVTLSLFVVLLCGVILPWRQSFLSVLLYLLLGLVGLPVFAGGLAGAAVFPGPTGGYLWSFLLVAPLVSLLSQQTPLRKLSVFGAILSCAAGVLVCYACGTLQFALLSGTKFLGALQVCVLPFLLPDACKLAAASVLGFLVRSKLSKQSLS